MLRKLLLTLVVLALPVLCFAQYNETNWPVVDVGSPAPSHTLITVPGQTLTWYAGHVYHIQGFCFVDSGSTLVIQPGTIIKGDPGQAANATALIITPGAKIIAKGTKALPIIFTSTIDNVGDTSDVPDIASSRGSWGGLVIEGRAFTAAIGDTSAIEGVPVFTSPAPFTARHSQYGGGNNPNCHDNSGVLQYVSLRYPGSILAPNVEINGLSLAAVGDGTTIDHLDVYYSADDDIEYWGGSVNTFYTSIWYGDDDGWDTDEGWAGINQFGVMVKDPRWGDRETENDGRQQQVWTDTTALAALAPSTGGWGCNYPSYAMHANLTCLGQGQNWSGAADQGSRQMFREDLRGYWYNNVFMEQPRQVLEVDCPGGDANIDNLPSATRNLPSGAASIGAGHPMLDFVNNFWYKNYAIGVNPVETGYKGFISTGDTLAPLATARVRNDIFPGGDTTLTGKNHVSMDPKVVSYEEVSPPVRHQAIDLRPAAGSPLRTMNVDPPAYAKPNGAYTSVSYSGAFEPDKPMFIQQPWVTAYEYKIIPNATSASICSQREGKPEVIIGSPAPSHTLIQADRTFSADSIYHLEGFIFIDSGHTLYIEPGTTIKGDPGQAANATALIITPGARIIAPGTKDAPIIFTSTIDNVDDPNDVPDIASSRGSWGGLIIEGRAFTAAIGDTSAIEGVPVFTDAPFTARHSQYGGGNNPDCHDNSGILQYVSLRYPGSILAPNVEINGLSLAAVGDGTIIDHLEVYYSADDDIEYWGGSVNTSYTAIIYGDDDGWDTDEGWAGVNQFGFMLKDPRWGDRETENDGRQQQVWTDTTALAALAPSTGGWGCNYPSYSLHANLTCIGQGPNWSGAADQGSRQIFREDYRGYWYNNVFMEQPRQVLEVDCPGGDANIDKLPSATRNLPSGAASIGAGHPLLDFVSNFWWKNYDIGGSGVDKGYKGFISTGDTSAAPLATARVRNDIFPGHDTTLTGKNFLVNPQISGYGLANPPVRGGFINPVPFAGGHLATKVGAAVPSYAKPNNAYTPVTYIGAFDPNVPLTQSWIWGWTVVSNCYNILGTNPAPIGPNPSCCTGKRGNVNQTGAIDLGDLSALVSYLTGGGFVLPCVDAANVNGVGAVDLGDLSALVSYLTGGGFVLINCP